MVSGPGGSPGVTVSGGTAVGALFGVDNHRKDDGVDRAGPALNRNEQDARIRVRRPRSTFKAHLCGTLTRPEGAEYVRAYPGLSQPVPAPWWRVL